MNGGNNPEAFMGSDHAAIVMKLKTDWRNRLRNLTSTYLRWEETRRMPDTSALKTHLPSEENVGERLAQKMYGQILTQWRKCSGETGTSALKTHLPSGENVGERLAQKMYGQILTQWRKCSGETGTSALKTHLPNGENVGERLAQKVYGQDKRSGLDIKSSKLTMIYKMHGQLENLLITTVVIVEDISTLMN